MNGMPEFAVVGLVLVSGVSLTALVMYVSRQKAEQRLKSHVLELTLQLNTLNERASQIPLVEEKLNQTRDQLDQVNAQRARLEAALEHERTSAEDKIAVLTRAKEELRLQFKSLATEILEDKTKKFTADNKDQLGQILEPLKERLNDFKDKIEAIHTYDIEKQAELKAQLNALHDLNQQLSADAQGLTTALTGQAKMQGNWGELILENVLDRSGLRQGIDFQREASIDTEAGRRRPDVIVNLPQDKHLVIDAKVSLRAYTRYVNATDEAERKLALTQHVAAMGERIKELSQKNYFDLPGLNSPEMVFMFVPIESAFVDALKADESLFQKAIDLNILIATPTTLLTSLNIVRQLWRFEEQNKHTAELADRAGKVYAKLVTFLESMSTLGSQLENATKSYEKAMNQLVKGRGNLIKQAHEFKELGVSVHSDLPELLVERANLEIEHLPTSDDAR